MFLWAPFEVNLTADIPSCLACLTLWPLRRYQRGSCWCNCAPCWGSRWWRTAMVRPPGTTGSSSVPALDSSVWLNSTAGPGEVQKVSDETESRRGLIPSVQTTCGHRYWFIKYNYICVLFFSLQSHLQKEEECTREKETFVFMHLWALSLSCKGKKGHFSFFAPPAVTTCTNTVFIPTKVDWLIWFN